MNVARRAATALLALSALGVPARAVWMRGPSESRLILRSQPGDYVGGGQDYDLSYSDPGYDTAGRSAVRSWSPTILPGGEPSGVQFWLMGSTSTPFYSTALLRFETTGLGVALAPGVYQNAERFSSPGSGHPAIDVSFAGKGNNVTAGTFTVRDATYFRAASGDLDVASFSVTFEQHGEGSAAALFGDFTYRRLDAPTPVPEPGSLALLGIAFPIALAGLRRPRGLSNEIQTGEIPGV
jgi:hypothetical protein